MVNTRSRSGSGRRATKEMPNASTEETPPDIPAHPRSCFETGPSRFPAFSPFWGPVGKISKARCSSPILRVFNKPLPVPESQHEPSRPSDKLEILLSAYPIPNDVDMEPRRAAPQPALDNVGETRPAKSNITELARKLLDDTDDELDEVQSSLDPAFVMINGHKVKKEKGPLLSAIFDKYGDIATETEGKPPTVVAFFLERICAIFEKLEQTKFSKVTLKDVNEMLGEVRFLESQKLKLGWLHQRLQDVHDTKMSFCEYLTVKEEGKRAGTMIAQLRNELSMLEEKLAAELAKFDAIKKREGDIKARVNDLWTHSLVDGLL